MLLRETACELRTAFQAYATVVSHELNAAAHSSRYSGQVLIKMRELSRISSQVVACGPKRFSALFRSY